MMSSEDEQERFEDDLVVWEEEQVFLDDEGHIEIGVADKVELEER